MRWASILLTTLLFGSVLLAGNADQPAAPAHTYVIVDTGQRHCFDDTRQLVRDLPDVGEPFYGQDCHYAVNPPSYRDNGDGTNTDLNTGLQWQKGFDRSRKVSWCEAVEGAGQCRTGGHDDWRLPTIKELYSLIDFNGCVNRREPRPYIDTTFFEFEFGDTDKGDRIIDAQYWSATQYVGKTMGGAATVFGVNFADGRIKGYPRDRSRRGGEHRMFVRYVRGNPDYGKNRFVDNGDGTVSDLATGLMWTKADSGKPMNWRDALAWAEGLDTAGHSDWRLPNAKELQSLVDYTRSPGATNRARRGPAIDPVFDISDDEAWFWTGTTHYDGPTLGTQGVYVAFGRATGFMPDRRRGGDKVLMDVHGAGAQRSDPKRGDPDDKRWAQGRGPQGDVIRILNYVRAVRNIDPKEVKPSDPETGRLPRSVMVEGVGHPPEGGPGRGPRRGLRRPPRGVDRRGWGR